MFLPLLGPPWPLLYTHRHTNKQWQHNNLPLQLQTIVLASVILYSYNEHINDVVRQTKLVIEAIVEDILIFICYKILPAEGQMKRKPMNWPLHNRHFLLCCDLSASEKHFH